MTRDSGQLAVHHRGLSKPVVQARLLLHRAVMNQLRYAVTTLSMQPVKYPSPLCLPSQRQGTHEQWRGMWPTAPVVSPLREVSPRPQLHTLRHDVPSPRSIPAGGKSRQLSPGHHTPGATSRTTTASPRQLSALPTAPPSRQLASRAVPGSCASAARLGSGSQASDVPWRDAGGDLSWQSFKRSLGERVAAPVRPEVPSRRFKEPTWAEPALVSRYDTPSASRSPVTQLLFPRGDAAICPTERSGTASERLGSLRKPHAVDQLGSLDGDVSRGTASRAAKAAGRARAAQLAERLARDIGPASWSQSRARGLFGRCDEFTQPELQEELLKLTAADLFPHQSTVDEGLRELAEQVGLQCEERGLLVEYMRRHYVDALQVSMELLRILQGTLRTNKQLRAATDASLMQSFQGFLGETMRSMQPAEDSLLSAPRLASLA